MVLMYLTQSAKQMRCYGLLSWWNRYEEILYKMAALSKQSRSKQNVNTVISAWKWLKMTAVQDRTVSM